MVKMIFWSHVINHNNINREMVSWGKDWVIHTLKAWHSLQEMKAAASFQLNSFLGFT